MKLNTTTLLPACRIILFLLIFSVIAFNCRKPDSFSPINESSSDLLNSLADQKPNIILILGDDIGYEVPTVNGGQSYATPNIDRMAQMGMRFTGFHASPLCSPSRVMLLTGKYGFRNYALWGVMDTTNRTIANMLKDAGYKTCVAGKWQLDGGDAALHTFGFEDYMIWSPFTAHDGQRVKGKGSRYKDPVIYQDGKFLSKTLTLGKFGDDMFTNHIKDFIDNNKTNPFFIYYPICLSHQPFEPPPNNSDFVTWDPKSSTPDSKYFPDMINYMDTKIGEIMDKVSSAGIADKTLVIFVGDNGTDAEITSIFNGSSFQGGKSETNEAGTHVPLLMWWQGTIMPATQNNFLLDLTDFLPTLADVAGISKPTSYGPLDGVSFYSALTGSNTPTRSWIYCYYDPNQEGKPEAPPIGWVQDTAYKLYDSTGLFYHYSNDLKEKKPLSDASLTKREKTIKKQFQTVLAGMHN